MLSLISIPLQEHFHVFLPNRWNKYGAIPFNALPPQCACARDMAQCFESPANFENYYGPMELWAATSTHTSVWGGQGALGLYSQRRRRLISIGIPIINLRRSSDPLRFIMGIPMPIRRPLLSGPGHSEIGMFCWTCLYFAICLSPATHSFRNLSTMVIQFWNAFVKLCCDPCHSRVFSF